MKKRILFLTSAACAATSPAFAAPDATTLATEAIIVTATRTPVAIDRIASSITVLDKDAIDTAQDISVSDLLARTPGISIARNGGFGTTTALRIRGAESDQTVVVIDGVKLNDPSSTGGGYNFGTMLMGDIDRIEVLRGPQSILWGSQAIGGVVNIVTAAPEGPFSANIDVEAGSRETLSARAGIGGANGPVRWRLGGYTFTTQGISTLANGSEADFFRSTGLNGQVEVTLTDDVSADLRAYWTRGRGGRDGFDPISFAPTDTPEYGTTDEFVGYAGLKFAIFDGRLKNRVGYGRTEIDRDDYNPAMANEKTFESVGRNERFEYQGSFDIAKGWFATFGAEHEKSRFESASPPFSRDGGKTDITSFYAQLTGEVLSGLNLSGGIRHDDHATFGGKTLFSAGAAWSLESGTIFRASYGEGFKAPTLYQLFSEYGNLALAPERAKGWEAGIEQRLFNDALVVGATWFERTARDQIDYMSCFVNPADPLCVVPGTTTPRFGYYSNTADTRTRGVELAAAARLGTLSLTGNYSWMKSENRSEGQYFGNWLRRRPRETANVAADYIWSFGLVTGAAVRWSGKTFEDEANTVRLDDYTLVDLRAEYPIGEGLTLFGRVENLFDEQYQTVINYGTFGRSVYAGIRARF